jgi:hypothetical protein
MHDPLCMVAASCITYGQNRNQHYYYWLVHNMTLRMGRSKGHYYIPHHHTDLCMALYMEEACKVAQAECTEAHSCGRSHPMISFFRIFRACNLS